MGINRKVRVLTNDSVIYYMKLADEYLTGERKKSFMTEVRLKHIRSVSDWTENESLTIEELTAKYANPEIDPDDIYFQIERNYALGMAAALSMSEVRIESYKMLPATLTACSIGYRSYLWNMEQSYFSG